MDSFLSRAWSALTARLGALSAFIPKIAQELEISIRKRDKARALKACDMWDVRSHESRETLDAGDQLMGHVREMVADDKWDAEELARGAILLERFIDEGEDIITGIDEDDAPIGETGTMARTTPDNAPEPPSGGGG